MVDLTLIRAWKTGRYKYTGADDPSSLLPRVAPGPLALKAMYNPVYNSHQNNPNVEDHPSNNSITNTAGSLASCRILHLTAPQPGTHSLTIG